MFQSTFLQPLVGASSNVSFWADQVTADQLSLAWSSDLQIARSSGGD